MTGPLDGFGVVVTRAREQAEALETRLQALGARVILAPAIALRPVQDTRDLDGALERLYTFQWLVLTSANGVQVVLDRLWATGRDARHLAGIRVAAIGPGTAATLRAGGIRADLVPERYVAEGLLEAMQAAGPLRGERVLLARAREARKVLPEGLRAMGLVVEEVTAYETVADGGGLPALDEADIVTFTSSSTVRHFVERVGLAHLAAAVDRLRLVSIGPITSETLRGLGLPVSAEAATHDLDGLVEAVITAAGGEGVRERGRA